MDPNASASDLNRMETPPELIFSRKILDKKKKKKKKKKKQGQVVPTEQEQKVATQPTTCSGPPFLQ
jgi:hypothetical protein